MRERSSSDPIPAPRSGGALRRHAKSWWRRVHEAATRLGLQTQAALGRRRRLRVAAAVTGRFPQYFHSFVYQELLALHQELDVEVGVFYLLDGDRGGIDPAFAYLLDGAVRMPNAAEISARDLGHYRRVAGDRVTALLAAIATASGHDLAEVEAHPAVQQAFTFTRRIELWGADYVHSYFFYGESLFGLVAQWMLGLPRGITAYADHVLDDWPLKVVPLHLETANVVVATSRRVKDELVALGPAGCAERVLVKPNGVDGRRFPFAERRLHAGAPFELVSVSRLEAKKGLLELLDAIALLRRDGRAVRVHIVGAADPGRAESSGYARAVDVKAADLGLRDVLVFHGQRSQRELLPVLHRCHAFVAPYVETERGDKDGIPTAMLEAMSTGLPVIATDAGSIGEVIDDGVEGWIVPQRDPAALAAAIVAAMATPDEVSAMGRRAHERFEREFDAAVTEAVLHQRLVEIWRQRVGGREKRSFRGREP